METNPPPCGYQAESQAQTGRTRPARAPTHPPPQGTAVDMAVGASALWQDEYDPFGPDSQPGNRMVVDLFPSRFHRHGPASKKDEDIAKYRDQLDLAWAEAYIDKLCCMVAVDASMPTGGVFQAAAAALVYRQGDVVSRVVSAAGRRAPPEVERFALQLGISTALAKGCQKLVVISDSLPAVESLFFFFLSQQFIMRSSNADRSKQYKQSTAYRYIKMHV
jgi:hypothetical protein